MLHMVKENKEKKKNRDYIGLAFDSRSIVDSTLFK